MLVALNDTTFGESRVKGAIFLERRFRAHALWRHRLLWDSRFAPPARPSDVATLFMVLDGSFQAAGSPATTGRQAWLLPETEFERIGPSSSTFRAWGDPLVTIEVQVPSDVARGPIGLAAGPRPVSESSWVMFEALVEALAVDDPAERRLGLLLDSLAVDGLLEPELSAAIDRPEPERFTRLWNVMAPLYGEYAASTSIGEIARRSGRSLRQLNRDLKEMSKTFGFHSGFRNTLQVLRLRAAVLLMSAPEVTAAEAARRVGYGTLDALGRAFRDAGLPPPSSVQAAVRYRD